MDGYKKQKIVFSGMKAPLNNKRSWQVALLSREQRSTSSKRAQRRLANEEEDDNFSRVSWNSFGCRLVNI